MRCACSTCLKYYPRSWKPSRRRNEARLSKERLVWWNHWIHLRSDPVDYYSRRRIFSGLCKTMTSMAVHYMADTVEWATPPEIFGPLNDEFHFDLDVCAQPWNAKCERYFTPEQ